METNPYLRKEKTMKMTHLSIWLMMAAGFLTVMSGQPLQAATITLTAEADKSLFAAEITQTAYLRVGLTGCPLERLKTRTPINAAIVIDKSGSMSGEKINKAREAAILALNRLNAEDIVSVVVYDTEVQVLVPATKMTCRDDIIRKIRRIEAGGTTALYAGVEMGAEEVKKFHSCNRVNRIVLLSDGLANVGPQSPEALGKLGTRLADNGISVTTIGLGLGYNEDLMSRLAYQSDGGHYFAETANELASVFDQEFDRALSVVAQEVRLEIICGEGMRPVRILGRKGTIEGRTVSIDLNQIYGEHEKYILVEIEIPGTEAVRPRELACVRLSYRDMNTETIIKSSHAVEVKFCNSKAESEKSINKKIMADVIEQIAIEQNERATALRDEGKLKEAKQILMDNSSYLRSNADKYDCPALEQYATENEHIADQLGEGNWTKTRKVMRESQNSRRTQQ